MVVLYDSKANQANSKRPAMPMGRGKEDDSDSDSDSEPRDKSANKPPTVVDEDVKSNINTEGLAEEIKEATTEAETWGKTVFVNLFPVSNENSRLGGWYPPAPQSDIPRLLSNALRYVARRKKTPSEPSS